MTAALSDEEMELVENAILKSSLLGALLLALGACADQPVTEAAPQTGATANATGGTGDAAAAGAAATNPNWLDLSACTGGRPGLVHYTISGVGVSLPQPIVRQLVLLEDGPTANLDRDRPLAAQVARGTGCADNPLPVGGVLTRSQFEADLLEGNVWLAGLARPLLENYAQVIGDLQTRRPENSCQTQNDLLFCSGQENFRGQTANVVYAISTDPGQRMNFGAPLYVRCEVRDGQVAGCNMGDAVNPQVFFDATLARIPRSTQDIRSAHTAILRQFSAAPPAGS
ncbi:MAG: hypothetical protein AAGF44_00030 [Pseudomonadota bacterium]